MKRRSHRLRREELETVTASHLVMEMTHLLVVSMKSCTPGLVESMLIFSYISPLILGASTILGASLILGASYSPGGQDRE